MVLKPALKLAYLLLSVTCLAILTLCLIPLPIVVKSVSVLLILVVAVYLILRDVLLALPHSWRSLGLNARDEIIITQKNGKAFICHVLPDSVVLGYLIVLRLKLKGQRFARSLVLVSESSDADVLRRWRVWLLWGRAAED